MGLAGRLAGLLTNVGKSSLAQRLAANGGKELLYSSIPGAVITAGLATMDTGNPIAGLAVGLGDLGLSYGTSRAISKYAPKYAGKYRNYVEPEQLAEAQQLNRQRIPISELKQVYEPSMAQQTAMLAGSIAAPMALEPMFMPHVQQDELMNQSVTQQQQLAQQEDVNEMYNPYTADGTLYQLQGIPYRSP